MEDENKYAELMKELGLSEDFKTEETEFATNQIENDYLEGLSRYTIYDVCDAYPEGFNEAKAFFNEKIVAPIKNSNVDYKSVLLYGSTEAEKIAFVKALASDIKWKLISVSADKLMSKYIGQTAAFVFETFESIVNYTKENNCGAVVYVENLEAISIDKGLYSFEREAMEAFIECMLKLEQFKNILLIASVSDKSQVQEGALQYFQNELEINS